MQADTYLGVVDFGPKAGSVKGRQSGTESLRGGRVLTGLNKPQAVCLRPSTDSERSSLEATMVPRELPFIPIRTRPVWRGLTGREVEAIAVKT